MTIEQFEEMRCRIDEMREAVGLAVSSVQEVGI